MHADYEAVINCLVLPSITEKQTEGLQLADPNFHEPGTVDLILGAGMF